MGFSMERIKIKLSSYIYIYIYDKVDTTTVDERVRSNSMIIMYACPDNIRCHFRYIISLTIVMCKLGGYNLHSVFLSVFILIYCY